MQYFIQCPICKDAFINDEFYSYTYGQRVWKKSCIDRLNHKLEVIIPDHIKEYKILTIDLAITSDIRNMIYCYWDYRKNTLIVSTSNQATLMPWIEPDLSNYKYFINKIKTSLILS